MLSEEMMNEIRKNAATNGRWITAMLAFIGLHQSIHLTVVMALLALCAAYLADFLTIMQKASLAMVFGMISFALTALAVTHATFALLN